MSSIRMLARIAHDWARRCFGAEHVTNIGIRALRALEECAEMAQAAGVPFDKAALCIDTVYKKPVGELHQEIGGTLLTTVVLCEALEQDPEELLEREVRRVLAKSPKHFAERNQSKIDLGLDHAVLSGINDGMAAGLMKGLTGEWPAPHLAEPEGSVFKTVCTRPSPHICGVNEPCNGLLRISFGPGERERADRMWRDAPTRRDFEKETGVHRTRAEVEHNKIAADRDAYDEAFNRWALIRIRRTIRASNEAAERAADNDHAQGYLASDRH